MLTLISVFTCLIFAVLYPLGFWIVKGHPISQSFRRFNITAANVAGGLTLIIILLMDLPLAIKVTAVIWKIVLLSISSSSWKRETVKIGLLTVASIIGLAVIAQFQRQFVDVGWMAVAVTVLGGLVLCLSLFSMILGHWYLNVPGLPIQYLLRATYVFWGVVGLRAAWDIYALFSQKLIYRGEWIYAYQFLATSDGFLLCVPLFFATLLPLFVLYFVRGTLLVKSTQSATGLLYTIVIGVLMGDLAYKFYLFRYGLFL